MASYKKLEYQHSAQVVLGRGDNRAASNFLPEIFYKGSKTIVSTWTKGVRRRGVIEKPGFHMVPGSPISLNPG